MTHTELVPFHGQKLEAIRDQDGRIWLGIKRACEVLGLGHATQIKKLQAHHWAVVCFMPTTASDGKQYEQAMIDAESIPMWLATIQEGRVKESLRPMLRVMQQECRDALFAHFSGQKSTDLQVYGDIGKAVAIGIQEGLHEGLTPVHNDIKEIKSDVADLKDTVGGMIKRQPILKRVRERHINAIHKRGGYCPCCMRVRIVDANGFALPNLQMDHFEQPSRRNLGDVWAVCDTCNRNLNDREFKTKSRLRFENMQRDLRDIESREQPALINKHAD